VPLGDRDGFGDLGGDMDCLLFIGEDVEAVGKLGFCSDQVEVFNVFFFK